MKHLLIAVTACAVLATNAIDAAAQRGGRGGFNFNDDGGGGFRGRGGPDDAPAGAPSQLPQTPPDFAAPAPPQLPTNFAPAPPAPVAASGSPATAAAAAAAAAPQAKPAKMTTVRVVDGLVSVQATAVPLSQLVKLLDNAMGTSSRIKKDLEGRTVSVRFDDLPYEAAVRKIFQGVPLDYIVVPGEGVIVTAASGAVSSGTTAAPPPTPVPQPITSTPGFGDNPPFAGATLPGVPPAGGNPEPFTPPGTAAPAQPAPPQQPAPGPAPIQAPNFNDVFAAPLPAFGAPGGAQGGAPAGGPGLGGGALIPFGPPIQ